LVLVRVPLTRTYTFTSVYRHPMTYTHTQFGRWHVLLYAFTVATLAGAWVGLANRRPLKEVVPQKND